MMFGGLEFFGKVYLMLMLAATMQGETEVMQSQEAARAVYEVAMNRVAAGWYPEISFELLSEGFNGWQRVGPAEVEQEFIFLAVQMVMGLPRPSWEHKAIYMFSEDDVKDFNFDKGKAVREWHRGRWGIYLFEEWPG